MLRLHDTKNLTEYDLVQNINTINPDIIQKIQGDVDPDDVISLVFLLYDSSETALQRLIVYQRVSKDSKVNHINLLYEWAVYAQSQPTWKYELLEALTVCRLYNVIRKLGFNITDIKKHYLPENLHFTVYMHPIKKILYRICECLTVEDLFKFKKTLNSYEVDVFNHDNAELLFLDLICKRFITLGVYKKEQMMYSTSYNIEPLIEILDNFSSFTAYASALKEMQTQVNSTNNLYHRSLFTKSSIKHYKSDLNNTEDTSQIQTGFFNEINEAFSQLQTEKEDLKELKKDTQMSDAYPIKNISRVGLCCIINQENFYPTKESIQLSNKVNLADRLGSSVDVLSLEKTMKELNFVVITKKNLSQKELFSFLIDVIQTNTLPEDSMFMLCILSHGIKGHIYAADSMKVKIQDIENLLDSDQSHKLYNIPKVLIIQACQSEQEPNLEANFVPDGPYSCDRYLKKTHFLVYWATAPEYEAFRDVKRGSLFIICLCIVLKRKARYDEILHIFTAVTNLVSLICTARGCAQVPEFKSTLRKKLFFNNF